MELKELGENRSGEPVVLVHGFAASSLSGWVRTGWSRALERAGFRPLGVDLPGHGRDGGPVRPGITRAHVAERIGDLVAGLAAARPVPLIGYSLGAQLAWSAAARHPEIGPLVLGGLGPSDHLPDLARALARDPSAAAEARGIAAALLPDAPPGAAPGRPAQHWAALARQLGAEPFDPASAVPGQSALLFAGALDAWAEPGELARCRPAGTTTQELVVPGRGHVDVLTARAARRGAVEFLARTAAPGIVP